MHTFTGFIRYLRFTEAVKEFHRKTEEEYWISAVIIQEIFDAAYTGIVQKADDGYIIEITKGHFLTKDNNHTSQYYIKDGVVSSKNENHQENWYRIIQGHVIECFCNDEKNSLVSISDVQVESIIDSFSSILEKGNRVVEFGLIRQGNYLVPYLIDFVDSDDKISELSIRDGIISTGKRCGRIRHIKCDEDALNAHFHDSRDNIIQESEELIFLCETPNIALLNLIDKYDNSKIAFAFEDGSFLCHLFVLLREKGIPAIKIGKADFPENSYCEIDAQTDGITIRDRIKVLKDE